MKICSSDPLIDVVRENFGATALKSPDARFAPGSVIALNDRMIGAQTTKHYGDLVDLLPNFELPEVHSVRLPFLERRSTSVIGIKLALDLLSSFLPGFGLDTNLGAIKTSLAAGQVSKVSFTFPNARRRFVHTAKLGVALSQHQLERHSGTHIFFDGWKIMFVDGVIETDCFFITTEHSKDHTVTLGTLPVDIDAGVRLRGSNSISVRGQEPVPFAVTCVELEVDRLSGHLSVIPENRLESAGASPGRVAAPPRRRFLAPADELFELR